jgi:hypothetical protein
LDATGCEYAASDDDGSHHADLVSGRLDARDDYDGRVIEGPAVRDLKPAPLDGD